MSSQKLPLPPGPPQLPLVGNLFNVPTDKPFIAWYELSKKYGKVVSINMAGQAMVILNSHEAAEDLLQQQGVNYSDRPRATLIELIDGSEPWHSKFLITRPLYNAEFRLHQRMAASGMMVANMPRFHRLMELESTQLLLGLLQEDAISKGEQIASTAVGSHLERMQNSLLFGAHYGRRFPTQEEPWVQEVIQESRRLADAAGQPNALQFLPFLTWLPAFLSPWKQKANAMRSQETKLFPQNMNKGLEAPFWTASKVAHSIGKRGGSSELDAAYTIAGNFTAGSETTPRAMTWFLIACTLNQEAVRRSHEQLERVVGKDRMPAFSDMQSLPYIEALVLETLRWRPIIPQGIPHRAVNEGEYQGMRIPAGALLLANSWGIGREAEVFGEAGDVDDFIPERYLEKAAPDGAVRRDLPVPIFGYGRRQCVGKRVGLDGMLIGVARLLWAFDIQPADTKADAAKMSLQGFTQAPDQFKLVLKPRGAWVKKVVQWEWESAVKDLAEILGPMDSSSEQEHMDSETRE